MPRVRARVSEDPTSWTLSSSVSLLIYPTSDLAPCPVRGVHAGAAGGVRS
jgi:hypothetical protein